LISPAEELRSWPPESTPPALSNHLRDGTDGNAVPLSFDEVAMPERIDRRRTAPIAYDVCRRALAPSDPARKAAESM